MDYDVKGLRDVVGRERETLGELKDLAILLHMRGDEVVDNPEVLALCGRAGALWADCVDGRVGPVVRVYYYWWPTASGGEGTVVFWDPALTGGGREAEAAALGGGWWTFKAR